MRSFVITKKGLISIAVNFFIVYLKKQSYFIKQVVFDKIWIFFL